MNASGSKPQSRTSSFLRAMGHRASDNGTGGLQIPEAGVRRRPSFVESFLGRSRKKSLVPEVKPPESEGSQSRSSLIADGRASSVSASDSTVTPTSHSFGSMVAARLSPSKHKFRLSRSGSGKGKAKAPAAAPVTGYTSDSQLDRASRYHRRMSSERSHPVPHRPTITVSASPDTFDDLFTKPINPIPPTHTPSASISSLPQSRRKYSGPGDATSGDESEALSTLSLPSRTYTSRRLRRGQGPSNIPSLPPSAPLPAPPTSWSPPNVPVAKPRHRAESSSTSSLSRRSSRPRSLTLSSSASVPPSPTTPRPPSPPPEPRQSSTLERKSKDGKAENEALDIYTASIDQLRQALISRNLQMEELASYLLKVTQNHVTEKNALEKRIASLEKEAERRDKEMNSLKWLVGNGRAQGTSVSNVSLSSSASRSSSAAPGPVSFPPTRMAFPNRGHDHNDSETSRTDSVSIRESTDLSGAESSSSSRLEKMKTLSKAAPRSRIGSIRFQPMAIEAPLSDTASGSRSGQGQRSSISSFTSSGASSTSSNVPSNPPNAAMPLTSIPEATGGTPPPTPPTPPQGPPPPPTHTPSSAPALPAPPARIPKLSSTRDRDPAIVAAISTHRREKEKGQRSTKAQPPSTPARTPAAAYAANLQKNRPSIGQIMNAKSNT